MNFLPFECPDSNSISCTSTYDVLPSYKISSKFLERFRGSGNVKKCWQTGRFLYTTKTRYNEPKDEQKFLFPPVSEMCFRQSHKISHFFTIGWKLLKNQSKYAQLMNLQNFSWLKKLMNYLIWCTNSNIFKSVKLTFFSMGIENKINNNHTS